MENSWVVPQKVNHTLTIWSSNSTSRCTTRKTKSKDSKRCLYTNVQSSILLIKAKRRKQSRSPQMDFFKWYIHTEECYSGLIRNENLTHLITWTDLGIMLSEISQMQKNKYYMIPLTWGTKKMQLHRKKNRIQITRV